MKSFAPRNPDFAEDIRRRFAETPPVRFFGFEIDEIAPGSVTLGLAGRPEFGHIPGFFQAAIMAAAADYAGSLACYTLIPEDWNRTTLDFTLKFLGPAEGDRLLAKGRVLTAGRTISVAAVDLHVRRPNGDEPLCATALLTTHHSPPRAG